MLVWVRLHSGMFCGTIAFTMTRARTSRLKTWEALTSVPLLFCSPDLVAMKFDASIED